MTRMIFMTDTGPIAVVQPRSEHSDLSENELAWIGFLREISAGSDPTPSLAVVQAIRIVLDPHTTGPY